MADRRITKTIRGHKATDGAGVHLVRVLGGRDVVDFDPFLMLDSFDSENPADYVAGFPMHPHRGIETITYLIHGEIEHRDSLGNKGVIRDGQSQWMTAGSGILHQEMPKPVDRMLGLQIWLNLPRDEKMTDPKYFDITETDIKPVTLDEGVVRVISGEFGGTRGVTPHHIKATLYDITVNPGKTLVVPTKADENVFVFLIEGDAIIDGSDIPEKTAVLFGQGDTVSLTAPIKAPARFMFFSGKKLEEPIAWGGPIVMNTREELDTAFAELEKGTFIKKAAK
ncbi:pirin family protein [Eubacteriales bacterium OttesenSCG-928-A19]|nr:pirin family protein [Eubacteriales bacterium OttesenSCG-928-A19]